MEIESKTCSTENNSIEYEEHILGSAREISEMPSEEEAAMLHTFRQLSPENRIRTAEHAQTLLDIQKSK